MEKLNLSYLNSNSAKAYSFYMIPKELIDNPAFDDIDYGTKILYGLMLNRASLSAINPDFIDKNGNVYIIYTIEQVIENMRCSRQTAVKMLRQLEEIGLIIKKRQGQGKPSIIYVMDFSTINIKLSTKTNSVDFKKSKKWTSENLKNKLSEVYNLDSNHNHRKNPNFSDTNHIIHENKQIDQSTDTAQTLNLKPKFMKYDTNDINFTRKAVHNAIDLNALQQRYPNKAKEIQELSEIIIEILTSHKTSLRIAKEERPADIVKQTFATLNFHHIEYAVKCLSKNTTKVKSTKAYLQTTLWNSIKTINNYYSLDTQNFLNEQFGIEPK